MKAMLLKGVSRFADNPAPLVPAEAPVPSPKPGEALLAITACGVCHTELDEIEGRTPPPQFPVILGHQAVGRVVALGENAHRFSIGERVGVGWIYSACGVCEACRRGNENICANFRATGRDADGGYAEFMTVPEFFAHPIPAGFTDTAAAPLLCAGAIGYRSLRLTGISNGQNLGLTGFGASAHLVLQMTRYLFPETGIFVFARNEREQEFSRELGAVWAGGIGDEPPGKLHAVIDTTPAWKPVVEALKSLLPGGRLVINAIRKEEKDKDELLRIDYPSHLWQEKEIKSVANVARRDISEFLDIAAEMKIRPEVEEYPLEEANRALLELKQGKIRGAKVLRIN
jgi:propanol-preferring alcohol dehydrogenase